MAGSIKGIILEIGGDTSGLQNALKKVNSSTSSLSKELRGVNTLLKLNPKNTELLSQKQTILNEKMAETEEKLEILKKAKEDADEAMAKGTEISAENYRNLEREIINTENQLKQLKAESSNWTVLGKNLQNIGQKAESTGNKVGNLGMTLTKTITTAATAITGLAIKSFNEVDEGADIVIKKTGATGKAAENLEETYKKVAGNVAGSFEDVGNAVGEINTRFGFTGEILQKTSEDFLKFAKINDVDVNEAVQKVSRYMGDASIKSSKYKDVLDDLTSAAQASGISINSLTEMLTKYGAPMRALGLDTKESIAIFAGWEKAGVNTEIAFSGMKKAISNWGKAGKDSSKEFKKTLDEIEKAPNIAKATTKAIEVFGAKAGPDLADAIKGGRFEYEEFLNVLKKSDGVLENTYNNITDETDKAEVSMKKLKVEFAEVGKEILSSAYPAVEDILGSIKELIKKFNSLDPKMKKNILKYGAMASAMGPVLKTGGSLITMTGKGISSVGNLCVEIAKAKNGLDVAEGATGLLAKGISGLLTPAGLVTTAIGLAAGALVYFSTKETEAQKEAKKSAEEMANLKKSMEDYRSQIDETANANLTHINSVSKLKDELTTLVDKNGKVKKGYESRVSFILNELNSALGTEYKLNGNVIESYKKLKKEIDETIEKKKAEIKLNAEEEKYKTAIENQEKAVSDLKARYDDLNRVKEETGLSYDQLKQKAQEFSKAIEDGTSTATISEIKHMKEIRNVLAGYDDAESRVKTYTDDIKKYESDYGLFVEKKYNEIGTIIKTTTQDWSKSSLETLQNSITAESSTLETYKNMYQETGNQISLERQQQAEKNLESITNELVSRTSTIGELGQSEIDAWKTLADNSYEQYSVGLSKMSPEMQQKIQDATGVIAAGTPQMQKKAGELGEKTVKEFDKNAESKENALNTIQGYMNGLTDKDKRELLKQAGIDNVEAVLKELDKGNLSETNGKNILEGLYKGLNNNSWRGKILGKAAGLAAAVNKAFTGKSGWDIHSPSKKMTKYAEYYIQPISDIMNKRKNQIVKTAQSLAEATNEVFNTESYNFDKMQGKLNNQIKNETKTIFTTPTLNIYAQDELTPAKINTIVNTVNRRLGSQY